MLSEGVCYIPCCTVSAHNASINSITSHVHAAIYRHTKDIPGMFSILLSAYNMSTYVPGITQSVVPSARVPLLYYAIRTRALFNNAHAAVDAIE